MKQRHRTLIGIAIILIALYFGYNAVQESIMYYRGVDEVSKNIGYYSTHRVRMIGDIVNDTVLRTETGYFFKMQRNDSMMDVKYYGIPPQGFSDNGSAVVVGNIENGIFIATEINVKCPTKYSPKQE